MIEPVPTRILIVEDEAIVALHVEDLLRKLDYDVVGIAASGQAALDKIRALGPHLVLMDVHIQGDLDGIETVARIPPDSHVAVIYLTAYSQEATLARARATQPYGFIVKLFSERELHATIQMTVERRRADIALRNSEHRLEQANRALAAEVVERKRMTEALRRSEEDLRYFFELSPQWPWTCGPDGIVHSVPQQFADYLGLSVDEAVDGGWRALNHPEDRDRIDQAWAKVLRSGEPYDQEMRTLLPDGEYHWLRARAYPRRGEDGAIVRWYGVTEDIHARKLAEVALAQSEERFRRIYEESPLGIILLRADDTRIVQINPTIARSLDYTQAALAGRPLDSILQPADRIGPVLGRLTAERRGMTVERRFQGKDGRLIWARVRLNLLPAVEGEPDLVLAMLEDITEQRRVEAALAQAQKMEAIGQLTGGIAHDFNNLLGVIIGNSDLLRTSIPGNEAVKELSDDAMTAALRGADLVRRLLAFARRQPLQPACVDVNALVVGLLKLLSRTLGENIEIVTTLQPDTWPVLADPAQLEAALTNLATNARDAMPSGGRLTVATANRHLDADYVAQQAELLPGDYAMIEVTDTGVGIPQDVLPQIFEPFFTTKERGKGTGLGLSMVFGFVKQSGGHINVYSEAGAGTTFRLYLPRFAVDAATADAGMTGQQSPTLVGNGETVLVIEDSAALRRIVVRQITDLGYRAVEAANAAQALALLREGTVDLLFTDVVMPGDGDGFALAQAARAQWPAVKILLTSGFPETKLTEHLIGAGFRLLSKPYLKGDLARLLRETLDQPG